MEAHNLSVVDDGIEVPDGHDDELANIETSLEIEGGEGLIGRLREKRRNIRKTRTLTLDVPGYGGEIVARYKALPWEVLKRIGEKAEKLKHPKKELIAHADTIAMACTGLFWREPGSTKLVPLGVVLRSESPDLTFADAAVLADAFDFRAKNAREAVFGMINDEILVTAHHNEVAEWMQSAEREDDETFVGESESTLP